MCGHKMGIDFPLPLTVMQIWFILRYNENRSSTSLPIVKEDKWARKHRKAVCVKHASYLPERTETHTELKQSEKDVYVTMCQCWRCCLLFWWYQDVIVLGDICFLINLFLNPAIFTIWNIYLKLSCIKSHLF